MKTGHTPFEIVILVLAFVAVLLFTFLQPQKQLFLGLFYLLSTAFIISKAVRLFRLVSRTTQIIWILSIVAVLASCIIMALKPGLRTANYLWIIGILAFTISGADVLQPHKE